MKLKNRSLIIAILALSGFSCMSYPYLSLDVRDLYTESQVIVQYSFRSEAPNQSCIITLIKEGTVSGEVYSRNPEDGKMPRDGQLVFSGLEDGDYILRFCVLSDRGRIPRVLPFLDRTFHFTVDVR